MNADKARRDRRHRVTAAIVIIIFWAAYGAAPAAAQQRTEHRSIIDFLFGTHRQPSPPQASFPSRPKPPARRHSPQPATRSSPPAVETVEKVADARKVLVVGDFVASGLADGLSEAFADAPGVVVVDRTNGSSGLVRDDYYDWPGRIGAIIEQEKPAAVVVLIGSNDRQAMRIAGTSEPVRSDAWTAAYTQRVEALARAVTSHELPLIWAGVPAFQSSSMSEDILAIDGIDRDAVAKAGGEFVDTWDGFVDENGKFVFTGSDINGQPVRLRGSDGINFTRAGKRKLAFYVEKPLRRLLGTAAASNAAGALDTLQPDQAAPAMQGPQLPEAITRTPPIGLRDPALDGDTALLGGAPLPNAADTPRTLLVDDGKAAKPPAGRADDFTWAGHAKQATAGDRAAGPHGADARPVAVNHPDATRAGSAPANDP